MMAYAGTAEDLPRPEDAPARSGALPLLVRPDMVMDARMAVRKAIQACFAATKGNVQSFDKSSIVEVSSRRTTSCPPG